ncbi:MAG: Gfo/Idh/MocA family oxidoreductase [Propionibacteriaceae bacterium]|jgi:predicted dehydrogenase|nr:Gfo/Idh/MocA family oxidoreductase [Propionibacteriaceae bacterium]
MPSTQFTSHPGNLRVGIIGGGFIGQIHARSIRVAGATIHGLADISLDRAREVARQMGVGQVFDSAAALIESPEIDVVHICTPNWTHAELALRAIEAGKHVVCEKPLTTSVEDGQRLVEASQAAGVVATVPFIYRFHPMARELRAQLQSDDAGAVHMVTGAYLQDWMSEPTDTDWRVDSARGGATRAFGDIGSHLVDFIEFVIGDRLVTVRSAWRTVYPERAGAPVDTEDLGAVLFDLAGGGLGTLTVSQVAPGYKNSLALAVSTDRLSLKFDQESPENLWLGRRVGSQLLPRDTAQLGADAARLCVAPGGHPLGYLDAFAAFVGDTYAAIAGNPPDGLPTFTDGLRVVTVIEAIAESARTGASVTVAPTPALSL